MSLHDDIRRTISLEVWTLDYEPGTDDRCTLAERAATAVLAIPEIARALDCMAALAVNRQQDLFGPAA
jgi:hypothetical protein